MNCFASLLVIHNKLLLKKGNYKKMLDPSSIYPQNLKAEVTSSAKNVITSRYFNTCSREYVKLMSKSLFSRF